MSKKVCDIIRERIINAYYKPGDFLIEKELAKQLKVSRTPIREALKTLAGENLVTIRSHTPTRVSDINLHHFQEMIELRLLLEKGSARLAAQRATEEQIKKLEQLNEHVKGINNENASELIDCDREFHQIISQAAHNNLIAQHLSIVMIQFIRINKLLNIKPYIFQADLPKVIKALKRRDADQMEKLIEDHVELFVKKVRRRFEITR